MYLSYADFTNMGGTLSETAFNDLEFEASSVIDWYTFGRLRKETYATLSEDVKKCCYHIINLILKEQQATALATADNVSSTDGTGVTIASQSNDGVSISYNVLSAKDAVDNIKSEIEDYIKRSLTYVKNSLGQKVLYRGFYPGE